ncbi:FAD-dependent oxidoreductase [Bosea sp. TND4EK4]|uniref:FAD-dependent oxidoreductase n=1 Tax=Bosea sp. TND4EK4 TaxID=1907408 RepID=UPI0009566304|nr:FAD-dependent oxidoreductase [Bosea sp. TND4EK4]SIR41748.1 fumarate reductase flavoprotein subunit [Bosea sp. TND4EK4]
MNRVLPAAGVAFEAEADVLIVGAGAAGLVAALAASEAGAEVVVVERDAVPSGSTALSAGLIPAAGTRFQREAGIEDSPELFAADIMAKAEGEPDPAVVGRLSEHIGPALEWLADAHGLPFDVVTNFSYPGHSARRMHGLPKRTGSELIGRLREAVEARDIPILTEFRATTLFADDAGRVAGLAGTRPGGGEERIGCKALILACNGYGGHRGLVARHIPQLAEALWFGHSGNEGDAVLWGEALGAELVHMSGHQGHGSVAQPHGILISWATVMEGGFQVNTAGQRFSDESHGYSEQAATVLTQPAGKAWTIFDERIAGIARQFEDFRQAEAQGAIVRAQDMVSLAAALGLPATSLAATAAEVAALKRGEGIDRFGRDFRNAPALEAPFCAVRVTGALFHTQGGLRIDTQARVLRPDGAALPNLFACGGAAVGVSGSRASGYLSGNGLLTAVCLGEIAGREAARPVRLDAQYIAS